MDGNSPAPDLGSAHVLVAPTRTRVVLCGEIDAALTPELQEASEDAEAAGHPIEVDARRVTFMDSAGFTLLARLATRGPTRLRVIEPPDVVRFLLDVTKIGELVDVVEVDPGFDDAPGGGPSDPPPDDLVA
jgi:anti-anti-sigma factor